MAEYHLFDIFSGSCYSPIRSVTLSEHNRAIINVVSNI